jgi:hypothetical protein
MHAGTPAPDRRGDAASESQQAADDSTSNFDAITFCFIQSRLEAGSVTL